MKKAIPIGVVDYKDMVQKDYYFVDKSLMIKDFLDYKKKVTLITRPRRFGKTLNMSMMAEFFDITKDSKDVFKDTKIIKTEYAHTINQYPTIFLSFANAKGTKQNTIDSIKDTLLASYEKYDYIFNNMTQREKKDYIKLNKALDNDKPTLDGIEKSILFLMNMLYKYYGKKVMLFIDEYDTPFIESHVKGYYDDIREQLASLLHNALKDAEPLEYAMLTGIQRVANENIFSDLNNLAIYNVSDNKYSSYFGFDYNETKQLLEYYELELNDSVKNMYDGYHIGNTNVYNPWSILNYVDNKKLKPYWVNTSANIMIKEAIKNSDIYFKNDFEALIVQGYLDSNVTMGISFYEKSDSSTLWGLFVNAGYLTVVDEFDEFDELRLKIPNNEVVKEFKSLIANYLDISSRLLNNIAKGLLSEDQAIFFDALKDILLVPSYHDYKSENSYHMLFLSLCIYMQATHKTISNRESGHGRPDIILKSKTSRYPSYVIEFKYDKESENTDKLADIALDQIERKGYGIELTDRIIHIGLGVHGKKASMKWIVKQE